MVDARGAKKKKKSGSSGLSCVGLDCSATCCNEDNNVCYDDLADCAGYTVRDYDELYVGFGSLVALMVGVPLTVKFLNCFLLAKMCKKYNESTGSYEGGYSFCDILSLIFGCCNCKKQNDTEKVAIHPDCKSHSALRINTKCTLLIILFIF